MSSPNTNGKSEWDISTDIYQIVNSVDKLKAKYVDDVDETTLALGIFGFLGDVEAKKIQTSTIMAGELGNEMFPARAKLNKNVLAHAIYCNVEGINAVPSVMSINLGIKEADLDEYMENDTFIFSKEVGIFIDEYEYHLDYDITLKRYKPAGSDNYVYTATYDMAENNAISNIKNAYLLQPLTQNFNNFNYIFLSTEVHQVALSHVEDTLLSDSIIENKSFTFTFQDQLADFEVYVTDRGVKTRLTPLFYGSAIEAGIDAYCWYLYINDNTVRISFDPNSYTPGQNATIEVIVRSTLGSEANFKYLENEQNDIYCDFVSNYSLNKKITCFVRCASDSANGKDRKSIDELKSLIPKMAMSRGFITTETDLNNYFNLITDENNIIKLQKKVDNQLERIWYAYYILKDEDLNIVPTNTIRIQVDPNSEFMIDSEDGRYIIPAGTNLVYDQEKEYAVPVNESEIPTAFSDEYFNDKNKYYYKLIHNIVINGNPLYAAYYITIVDHYSYFNYNWVNEKSFLGFATIRNHFTRTLLSEKNVYKFTFQLAQSVDIDYGLITEDEDKNINCKIKCLLVLYRSGEPYRYQECKLTSYDGFTSNWEADLETDDRFDINNRIRLTNVYEYGYNSMNPGYFENNCEAYLYIATKFDSVYMDTDGLLDKVSPGLYSAGYSLVDIYQVEGGITLFTNYTNIMNTKIVMNKSQDESKTNYDIFSVPVVGYQYFQNEAKVSYLSNALADKKSYIDYCLLKIENTMDIDFKFFNTYGYSYTYTISDGKDSSLANIDISMNFKLKLINATDLTTRDSIIQYIKNRIEDLNEQGDLHLPNLIHDIKELYQDSIVYIEFRNFNNNELGINHIELKDVIDPQTVPEFINIRNVLAEDGETLKPNINIELVTDD